MAEPLNADISSASELLAKAEQQVRGGASVTSRVWPCGLDPLDFHLGGGLRAGELTLVGGPQALGKTTFTLQLARNVVAEDSDATAVYICFEHTPEQLLERLIAMEAGLFAGSDAISLNHVREMLARTVPGDDGGLVDRLGGDSSAAHAVKMINEYGDRLRLVAARGGSTGLAEIRRIVADLESTNPVVFVDYLQKVFVPGDVPDEDERVTRVVEGLKDLALDFRIPVVSIVAADKSGVSGGRTRIHDLRGSTALLYEADVALMLNNKFGIIARHHLVYGSANVDRYHDYVVVSVEKNRTGRGGVDLEFRSRFDQGRFEPVGGAVAEQLIDERVFRD